MSISLQEDGSLPAPSHIMVSKDYNLFKSNYYNRKLQKKNLLQLKESVLQHNLLSVNPIICTKDLEIIDGNHRYEVCKELNLPLYYCVIDKFQIEYLINLNFSLSKWGPHQFLELYCKLDKVEYIKFKKFMDDFGFDVYLALPLTKKRDFRTRLNEKFRKGEFVFEDEQNIRNVVSCAQEFLKAGIEKLLFKRIRSKDVAFYDAYEKVMQKDDFNQKIMLEKLGKFGLDLLECANMSGYYTQLGSLLKRSK